MEHKKNKKFRSLQKRILTSILLLTISLLLFSQIGIYLLVNRRLERLSRDNCEVQMASAAKYLKDKTVSVIEKLFYIRNNESFNESLDEVLFGGTMNEGLIMGEMASVLSFHKSTEPIVSNIYLYTPKGEFSDMTVLINKDYCFEESLLYDKFLAENSSIVWGEPCADPIFITKRPVIPLIYKFYVSGCVEPVGILANIDQARLSAYLKEMEPDDDTYLALVTEKGALVTSNPLPGRYQWILEEDGPVLRELSGEMGIRAVENQDGNFLVGWQKVAATPWYVLYIHSEVKVQSQLKVFTALFFIITLGVGGLIIFMTTFIVRKLTSPITDLSRIMQTAGKQDYDVFFSYEKNDEIRVLADSFNGMVRYTKELFEEQERAIEQLKEEKERVRIEQLLKRRAEFMALQAQINPHFLYNTLDSIRWKAEELDAMEISDMVQALATLFRIDLSRGQELIPVRKELEHVTSYLSIQKYRFDDELSYRVEVGEEFLDYYVPKIILQPLVENSIEHGIKEKGGSGTIVISCARGQNGDVILRVADNGAGIEKERLGTLQDYLARGMVVNKEGYGIFNVNERIRLYFGEAYHLVIDSIVGEGTLVEINFPAVTQAEVEDYVPYFDSRR